MSAFSCYDDLIYNNLFDRRGSSFFMVFSERNRNNFECFDKMIFLISKTENDCLASFLLELINFTRHRIDIKHCLYAIIYLSVSK